MEGLLDALDPSAVLTSDGGGVARAAARPIHGAREIATFFAGIGTSRPGPFVRPSVVNDTPALLIFKKRQITTVLALGICAGRITTIDAIRNPHEFHGLRHPTAAH